MGSTLGSEEPPSAPEGPAIMEEGGLFWLLALPPVWVPDPHLPDPQQAEGPQLPSPWSRLPLGLTCTPCLPSCRVSLRPLLTGLRSWAGPGSRQVGSWRVAEYLGAGRGEARPSLRAPGPTGKCAPQLERKPDRARVTDSPGGPRMGTFWQLVLKWLCSQLELQTFLAGTAGVSSGPPLFPAVVYWALGNQRTRVNPAGP